MKLKSLSIFRTKIPTRHKQHFEFQFEFKPWDGRQMINKKFLSYILIYIWIKTYHKTNTNENFSLRSIHI